MTATEDTLDCIVADDEPVVRAHIERLASQAGLTVRGTAANGVEASQLIRKLVPDIAFLDIRMPGMNGLRLVEDLSKLPSPPVIVFVTAYAEHALTAFELSALDYVVKPVEADRFFAATERAKAVALGRKSRETLDRLRGALQSRRSERLTFRNGTKLVSVPPADVVRFQAVDDYVNAHTASSSYLLSVTMNALEAALAFPPFLRVHRSHIVNADQVTAARPAVGGRLVLDMVDGAAIPVSRARSDKVRRILESAALLPGRD
jgi:DNA-binding LytR/AlgR family response regulator